MITSEMYSSAFVALAISGATYWVVHDRVDRLSLSVGPNSPPATTKTTFLNPFDATLLAAVKAGVFVAQTAGNGGPFPKTLVSYSPWIASVAAAIDYRKCHKNPMHMFETKNRKERLANNMSMFSKFSPFSVSMELMFLDMIHFPRIFQTTKRISLCNHLSGTCSYRAQDNLKDTCLRWDGAYVDGAYVLVEKCFLLVTLFYLLEMKRNSFRRANRQSTNLSSSVLSSDSMYIRILAAAAHAAANNSPFIFFYNLRASPSEYVVPLAKYYEEVYSNQISLGMRYRMMFETEESGTRRYLGTITSISDLDPVRWKNSQWRNFQVGWDESTAGERRHHVSIWEIEPMTAPFFILQIQASKASRNAGY